MIVTPPSQRRVCEPFAAICGEQPILAGCAAAVSIATNKHAHSMNSARTLAFMTIPSDPVFMTLVWRGFGIASGWHVACHGAVATGNKIAGGAACAGDAG